MASKRIYVHESIYDTFLDRLVAEVEKTYAVQEDGNTPSVFGPLSNKMRYDIIKGIVEDCRKSGYKIATGGQINAERKGYWVPPTIVSKPAEDSWLVKKNSSVSLHQSRKKVRRSACHHQYADNRAFTLSRACAANPVVV